MIDHLPFDLTTLCAAGVVVGLVGILGLSIDARRRKSRELRRPVKSRIDKRTNPGPDPLKTAGIDHYTRQNDLLVKKPLLFNQLSAQLDVVLHAVKFLDARLAERDRPLPMGFHIPVVCKECGLNVEDRDTYFCHNLKCPTGLNTSPKERSSTGESGANTAEKQRKKAAEKQRKKADEN
jgi:hypothetical protein